MAAKSWGFSTLRELTLGCGLNATLTGTQQGEGGTPSHLIAPQYITRYSTFVITRAGVTFDCATPFSVPSAWLVAATFTAQQTYGDRITPMYPVFINRAVFSSRSNTFTACSMDGAVPFSDSVALGTRTANVLPSLQRDYDARQTQTSRAQLCLRVREDFDVWVRDLLRRVSRASRQRWTLSRALASLATLNYQRDRSHCCRAD